MIFEQDNQETLTRVTRNVVQRLGSQKIIGVKALWEDEIAKLTFYFSEEPTEDELEDASGAATEIIAAFCKGMLEEYMIVLDDPKMQLNKEFLAYDREKDYRPKRTRDESFQYYLTELTKEVMSEIKCEKIMGVQAIWKEDIAKLTLYFSKQPTVEEEEKIEMAISKIMNALHYGKLKKVSIILEDSERAMPEQFLAYDKERDRK